MSQLAQHMRQADRVERALWRDHRHRVCETATLRLSSIASLD
jgi:hypothetical protein